jgi:YVTN family beta-propeller protein
MARKNKMRYRTMILFVLLTLILPPINGPALAASAAASETQRSFSGWSPGFLGLAVAPDGKTAYVPFSQDDALLVVDLSNYAITASIDVSAAGDQLDSGGAVLTPDGKKLYVSNYGAGNVMVINTEKREVLRVLPIAPSAPTASTLSADESRVYIPAADGGLYIVDTTNDTYEHIAKPGVSFGPVAVSTSRPDVLYSTGMLTESGILVPTFFEFDLKSKSVKRTLRLQVDGSRYPITCVHRLAVTPDESRAYFGQYVQGAADKGAGNFYAIDLRSFTIKTSVPVDKGVADFAMNVLNNKIYIIGCWSGGGAPEKQSVQEWDMSADKIVRDIAVSPSSDQRAIVVDPADADCFYMTESDYNLLRKVEISTGKELGSVRFNKDGLRPYAIIPGGDTGYIIGGSGYIGKIDLTTGDLTGALHVPDYHGGGFYKGMLYIGGGDCIRKISPEDGSISNEYPVDGGINTQFFTFYGNRMVTIDFEHGGMIAKRLLLFDADTMSVIKTVELPAAPYGHRVLASPDGSKLYLVSGPMWGAPAVVTILDGNTLDTANTISIPPAELRNGATSFLEGDFDESGRILYLLGFTSVYKIDMDTDKLLGTLDLIDVVNARGGGWPPTGLSGIMLSGSKDKLFVVAGDGHSMYTYDLKKSAWSATITNAKGYFITNAVASPGRRFLFTVNNRSDSISMIDTYTGTVSKLIPLSPEEIIFQIGNPNMKVNGIQREIDPGKDTAPVLIDGRTLIPIRTLIESMGGKVSWDGNEQKVIIELSADRIELWINRKTALVNGVQKELDVPAQLINSRTMLPLRFVAENLGCTVHWDGATQTITIRY